MFDTTNTWVFLGPSILEIPDKNMMERYKDYAEDINIFMEAWNKGCSNLFSRVNAPFGYGNIKIMIFASICDSPPTKEMQSIITLYEETSFEELFGISVCMPEEPNDDYID